MNTGYKIILEVLQTFLKQLPEPDQEWPFKIREAVNFIHENLFDERLTVGWMREKLSLNNNNFSSKFRYYTGKGPKQYFDHLRLEAARQVLDEVESNDIAVMDVALEIGIQNVSTFTRAFKNRYGFPPGDLLK